MSAQRILCHLLPPPSLPTKRQKPREKATKLPCHPKAVTALCPGEVSQKALQISPSLSKSCSRRHPQQTQSDAACSLSLLWMHQQRKSSVLSMPSGLKHHPQTGQGMRERKRRLLPRVPGLAVAVRKRIEAKLQPACPPAARHRCVQIVLFRSSFRPFFLE